MAIIKCLKCSSYKEIAVFVSQTCTHEKTSDKQTRGISIIIAMAADLPTGNGTVDPLSKIRTGSM
jgi:hypothetical protein